MKNLLFVFFMSLVLTGCASFKSVESLQHSFQLKYEQPPTEEQKKRYEQAIWKINGNYKYSLSEFADLAKEGMKDAADYILDHFEVNTDEISPSFTRLYSNQAALRYYVDRGDAYYAIRYRNRVIRFGHRGIFSRDYVTSALLYMANNKYEHSTIYECIINDMSSYYDRFDLALEYFKKYIINFPDMKAEQISMALEYGEKFYLNREYKKSALWYIAAMSLANKDFNNLKGHEKELFVENKIFHEDRKLNEVIDEVRSNVRGDSLSTFDRAIGRLKHDLSPKIDSLPARGSRL